MKRTKAGVELLRTILEAHRNGYVDPDNEELFLEENRSLEMLLAQAEKELAEQETESEDEKQQMLHKGVPFGIIDGIPLVERQEILEAMEKDDQMEAELEDNEEQP
ncbi:MAG: hypothetical protein IK120_01230 [Muribaculaceae bacterium]|nr:hypothetical protein [Muribaculaceae bacterium]